MTDKHKKASEIARLVGVIQDLAKDIEQDATSVLVYKDKTMHLSEIRDGAYAIVDYVKELEKLVVERGRIATELRKCPFCGGEAIIVNEEATRKNVYGETIKGTAIGCRNCGCQMFNRNREFAIEAWNKRVSEVAE